MKYSSIILLYLFFLFSSNIFSQEKILHIEYDYYFQNYYPEERKLSLIVDDEHSLSTITRTILYQDFGETIARPKSFYTHFFRTRDSITFEESMDDIEYTITESLNQMKWELTGNSKNILDYICQEAKTNFRGRSYLAYFTTAVPFKAAPWKFHGLPGLTLAVETSDELNQIRIVARSLKIEAFSGSIGNPFTDTKEKITWKEWEVIVAESWENHKKKVSSTFSMTGTGRQYTDGKPSVRPELRMEVIVEGNGGYVNAATNPNE